MKPFPAKCHELRKVWRQTGNSSLLSPKCWPLLHVIRGGLMLSLESQSVFKVCFRFVLLYNKLRNDLSLGEQWILFLSNHNVSRDDILGKQNSLFPSLPVIKCKMITDIIVTWPNLGIFNTLSYLFWLASVAYKARLVLPRVFWLNYVSLKYGLWLVQTRLTCRWRVQKRHDLVRY